MACRERLSRHDSQLFDLAMNDFVRDPIAVVERIYERLGFELRESVRARMADFMKRNRRGARGRHRYAPAEFGIDRGREHDRFQFYRDRFDVTGGGGDDRAVA